jgi:transposase
MAKKRQKKDSSQRNNYSEEFKREAVQMLLDGHSATSIVERLGIPGTTMLYRWRREERERSGPMAASLETRLHELEEELRRVKMERDILKKALVIFGRIT